MSIKNSLKKRGPKVNAASSPRPSLKTKVQYISLRGIVTQNMPGKFFLVQVTHDPENNPISFDKQFSVKCYISGKIKKNRIHIIIQDIVLIEIPATGSISSDTLGRIFFRERGKDSSFAAAASVAA